MALAFQRMVAVRYLALQKPRSGGVRTLMVLFALQVALFLQLNAILNRTEKLWILSLAAVPLIIEIESWLGRPVGWRRAWVLCTALTFLPLHYLFERLPRVTVQTLRLDFGAQLRIAALLLCVAYVLIKVFLVLISRMTIFSTISTYGLFLGSAALVIVLSVMSGFEGDLKRKILGTNAHIVVTRPDHPFTDYENARNQIARLPGVVGVTPYLTDEVMISSQSNLSGVVLKGIDPATVGQVTDLERNIDIGGLTNLTDPDKLKLLGGPPIFKDDPKDDPTKQPPPDAVHFGPADRGKKGAPELLSDKRRIIPGVIIGRELAKNLRLYLGDDVSIVSPFGGIGPSGAIPKSKPFRVAGIFFSGMFEYDTKYIYLALPAAQKFFAQDGEVTGLELKVADPDRTEASVARIQTLLGTSGGYEVRDWKDLNRSLFSALKIEKILMFVLLCFIILVAAFSIIANGTMLVMEKGQEIAILKSMGASDRSILGTFMILGGVIGGIGTLAGILAGIAGCFALAKWGIPLNPEVYYITQLPVIMNPYEIVTVFFAALGIALLATLYPAWMAAQLRPVEGLREAQR